MYKCNLYDECSSNQSRSTHPSNESQAEQTHNRKVSWVMKPSFLLSIWRGATLFIRPCWNVLGESGGEKTLFYSHLPLHMKPKDYRQLLKLEAPAWGEGRGKRKVERLGCSPMLVCQLWRILIVTIVFASTWVVTLDLLTFRLESWCISPKNIVSVLRQLAQYPFLFDITFGISSWPLCTEQNTHHFIMIIILGNISSAVTEQLLFVQLDFAIYEKQKSISTFDFFWCLTYPPWN